MNNELSLDTSKRIWKHISDLDSTDQSVSEQAERRLIRFGPRAVDLLIQATAQENPQVRFRAVWALGKIKNSKALAVIVCLTHDTDERVAYDAIMALGELGDARAIPELLKIAARDEDERGLVSASLTSLTRLGYPTPDSVSISQAGPIAV